MQSFVRDFYNFYDSKVLKNREGKFSAVVFQQWSILVRQSKDGLHRHLSTSDRARRATSRENRPLSNATSEGEIFDYSTD